MKQLVGLAGVLLATSAGAGQPGRFAMPASVTTPEDAMAGHNGAAGLICETCASQTGTEIGSDDHSAEGQDPRQLQARNAIGQGHSSVEQR